MKNCWLNFSESFWPMSREKTPKQLLKLLGDRSFLQLAVDRVLPLVPMKNIFIITNEAQAAVPDELVDAVALVGPKEHIRDQLARWKSSPVTTMLIGTSQPEALRTVAELCL